MPKGKGTKKRRTDRTKRMPTTAELLEPLATLDHVHAHVPTSMDIDSGAVPNWCELVLDMNRDSVPNEGYPIKCMHRLTRHDGELVMQRLWEALHPKTSEVGLYGMIGIELDKVIDQLMAGEGPTKTLKGQAQGLTLAMAIMANPTGYDTDRVTEEAMERWARRNG